MKFRKKPIIIEAEQFDGIHLPKGCYGLDDCSYINSPFKSDDGIPSHYNPHTHKKCIPHCFIDTLEGTMRVDLGDWVITGVKDEKYPCKPDIFKMTYEKIKETKND